MPRHSPYALISLTYGFWNFQFELSELSFLLNVPVNFSCYLQLLKRPYFTYRICIRYSNIISYSIQLSMFIDSNRCHGGDEENRTPDPLLARQVLSQLSYTPMVT